MTQFTPDNIERQKLLPSQKKFRSKIAKINSLINAEISEDKSLQSAVISNEFQTPNSINKKQNKRSNSANASIYQQESQIYSRERKTRIDFRNRPNPNLNYYELYQQLQTKYEDLLAESIKQRELFNLRQDTFIEREKQSKEKYEDLAIKLRRFSPDQSEGREQMNKLHSLKRIIQNKIYAMKGETQKQLLELQEQYQKHVEEIIKEYKQQLEEERSKNSIGTKEWNERSRNLKENLKNTTIKAVELDDKNNELLKENQRLKIQFKAQSDDREYLAKVNARLKRANEKLREQVKELESELDSYRVLLKSVEKNNS